MQYFKFILLSLTLFLIGFVTLDEAFANHTIEIVPKIVRIPIDSDALTVVDILNGVTLTPTFIPDIGLTWLYSSPTNVNTQLAGDYIITYTAYHGIQFTRETRTYTVYETPSEDGGSGGCNNCESPTLGINSKVMRIVENGFTYNGESVNAERFFTPYPLVTVNVGEPNTAVFRIYEDIGPQNIKHFSFAFGLDVGQSIGESKAMIELDIDYDGTQTVTITDPENALEDVNVSTHVENCNDNGNDELKCLIVTIHHTFRAPLEFNIVSTDVWDMERNAWQNYFNHGIEVIGESLNPPKEYDGISRGHIYHLTETSKGTAIDEFGDSWTLQHGDTWEKNFVLSERIQDGFTNVMTRQHSEFANYKNAQMQSAIEVLLERCPTCMKSFTDFDDSFAYEFPENGNRLESLSYLMQIQELKAKEYLDTQP